MSAKKYLKMPAATPAQPAAKTEKEEQLWNALKRHIIRERERKKQELEAEVEEERQRKEREEREKQDVMTLGETKEQIQMMEKNLEELRNEKQQLFLQLKKVLNEDDNRKRQLKVSAEMFAIQSIPQQQLFLPQRTMPPHQQHMIHKGNPQVNVAKRTHSPSSPQHIPGYYKQPNPNNQPYPQPQKLEEGRRGGEVARAVLWNKSQYCSPVGFYPAAQGPGLQEVRQPPQQMIYPFQNTLQLPIRQYVDMPPQQQAPAPVPAKSELINAKTAGPPPPQPPTQASLYHIASLEQQGIQQSTAPVVPSVQQKAITIEKIPMDRIVPYHIDLKHDDRKDMRAVPLQQSQPPPPTTHLPEGMVYTSGLRQGAIQMHAIATNQQIPKCGSITQGYPSARPPPIANPPSQPAQIHYGRQRY